MFLLFEVLGCKIYFLKAWYKFWLFEVLDSKIYLLRAQTSFDFLKSYTYRIRANTTPAAYKKIGFFGEDFTK